MFMEIKIQDIFNEHIEVAQQTQSHLSGKIQEVCKLVADCLERGNKILLFGNGGSAADAQHIAAEFVGRFVKNRRSYPAIALTTDTSALTAIGNDYGFERIFARQVEGLAVEGDILIGFSTSGNSANVIKALEMGRDMKCINIGMSGNDGGAMNQYCDINLTVPSKVTARIQEMHITIGHIICQSVDSYYN